MNQFKNRWVLIIAAMMMAAVRGNGQSSLPEEFAKNSIKEQLKFLEAHTNIYENYRAIREDMFQKINRNVLDTLAEAKSRNESLSNNSSALTHSNDSLSSLLETARTSLAEMTATKNKIRVLGLELNKLAYNSIMWMIIAGLSFILVMGFFVLRRSLSVSIRTGKDIKDLKEEFEAYRQSSRIKREKMEMDHFNEIKKLKGK
jgi:hypothetical protein